MNDPQEELRRYLRQRIEMGEDRLFVEAGMGGAGRAASFDEGPNQAGIAPVSPAPTAPTAPTAPIAPTAEPAWRKDAPPLPGPGIIIPAPSTDLFRADPLAETDLDSLGDLVRSCTKCGLCNGRTNAVPGEGNPDARLMVIGEGPGATEDETGRPFVGRAGKLLDDILTAIDLPRSSVFIANIVKCRPPKNRNPEPGEVRECVPYLHRQIALIQPSVILAVGGVAATTLLDSRGSLGSLRNRVHEYRGIPLIVTYHPAALLRNPQWKKPTWDDVRIARRIVDGER